LDQANKPHVMRVFRVRLLAPHQTLHKRSAVVPAKEGQQNPQSDEDNANRQVQSKPRHTEGAQCSEHSNTEKRLEPHGTQTSRNSGRVSALPVLRFHCSSPIRESEPAHQALFCERTFNARQTSTSKSTSMFASRIYGAVIASV